MELNKCLAHYNVELGDAVKDCQYFQNRKAKDANIEDILAIFKVMDIESMKMSKPPPRFCAVDMSKLPPTGPEVAENNIAILEVVAKQQQEIQQLQSSVADIMTTMMARYNHDLTRTAQVVPGCMLVLQHQEPNKRSAQHGR
jgi:hypothetical protein